VHHYYYDAESRPVQVDGTLGTCSTAAACYVYDANGLRVQKTIGSSQTSYLYDLSGNVVAEDYGAGWAPGYVYAGGQLIAEYKNGTTYFVHGNHLGSSSIITSVAGGVVDCNAFYPFGEQDISICVTSNDTSHKFTGDERDTETNLDHTWFRKYTSAQGRWMTPDPAGLAAVDPANPQSWNRYAYVVNDPINMNDPIGLSTNCLLDNIRVDCSIIGVPQTEGPGDGWWVAYSIQCQPGVEGLSGGCTDVPIFIPYNRLPQLQGFTLGVRAPGQSYRQCLNANSSNYSLNTFAGTNNFLLSNDVGQLLFGDRAEGSAGLLFSEGGSRSFGAGVGTVMTAGRRTASITSMNLAGTTGPAPRILAKTGAEKLAGWLSGAVELKMAADIGLTGALVIGCLFPR
jgi:RHS repeat-associated protein